MRTTVGPLPPEIYWRRRLAAIGILVIALVSVRAFASGDTSRAGDQPVPKATPSASPDGTAAHPYRPRVGAPSPTTMPATKQSASGSPASASAAAKARPVTGPCTDAELTLIAAAGSKDYPVGAAPKLTMTVRNISARSCVRDLGPGARQWIVTSGPAHTWASDDCHPRGANSLVRLGPGAAQTFTETWAGKRSEPNCRGTQPAATAGTYRVQARLGSLRSELSVFRLR